MTEATHALTSGHAVAHQFEDARQQKSAATLGMWTFLATEVMFFGGLITGFAVYRFLSPRRVLRRAPSELNVVLGSVNTWVLLTSSLTMGAGRPCGPNWRIGRDRVPLPAGHDRAGFGVPGHHAPRGVS